jgi:serine protease Do
MSIHFTKPRIAAIAALAFVAGVFFASSMDWTRLVRAQSGTAGKAPTTQGSSLADQQNSFVGIAERVTPAVVSIDAQRDARRTAATPHTRQQVPPGFEQFFQFDDPQARDQEQTGSGFIVSKDGYVLTNNHVVEGADRVKVILTDRREFKARVVGRDPQTDIAVLKIEGNNLPTVVLGDDSKTRVGEWAVAIGNPLGLDFTVTAGIISAKGRARELRGLNSNTYAIQDFIQTDAAINPGNSGGPLVNIRGEVVGINSAIASQTGYYSGYGFAIPITLAKTVMDDIIAHGRVRRAIMGAGILDVNAEDAAVNKLPEIAGVKIENFNPPGDDNPAKRAGVEAGDIIVRIDGKPADRVSTLQRLIRTHQPGDVVELEAVRYGEHKTFKVKLAEAPTEEATVASAARDRSDNPAGSATVSLKRLGISVEGAAPPDVVRAKSAADSVQGVPVKDVERGGPAEGKLLGSNRDIITDVIHPEPRTPVHSVADLQRVLGKLKDGDIVGLKISRQTTAQGDRATFVVNVRVGGQ